MEEKSNVTKATRSRQRSIFMAAEFSVAVSNTIGLGDYSASLAVAPIVSWK